MVEFLRTDLDLTKWSSFSTPALATYAFEIRTVEDVERLSNIARFSCEQDIGYVLMGAWTNVLFAFDRFNGVVVRSRLSGWSKLDDGTYEIASGESVIGVCHALLKEYGDETLVPWSWLPGTIGGAFIGNAGCFQMEAKDILDSALFWHIPSSSFVRMAPMEFDYSYRSSHFKWNADFFLVSVRIRPGKYSPVTLAEIADFRRDRQPKGLTCGSYFKNPPAGSAGVLIDQCGLKGYRHWSARISDLHANFFLNDVGGSWQNILELQSIVQESVWKRHGVRLEPEVKIIHSPLQ